MSIPLRESFSFKIFAVASSLRSTSVGSKRFLSYKSGVSYMTKESAGCDETSDWFFLLSDMIFFH